MVVSNRAIRQEALLCVDGDLSNAVNPKDELGVPYVESRSEAMES